MATPPKDSVTKITKKKASQSLDVLRAKDALDSSPLSQSSGSVLSSTPINTPPLSTSPTRNLPVLRAMKGTRLAPSTTMDHLVTWSVGIDRVAANDPLFTILDLEKEGYPSDFLLTLGDGIKFNTHLQELNLSHHPVTSLGLRTLCLNLRTNHALKRLNLAYSEMDITGAQALCDLLIVNKALTSLNLQGNPGIIECGARFAEILKSNRTLVELNVQECGLLATPFKEALKSNITLTKLEASIALPSATDPVQSSTVAAKNILGSGHVGTKSSTKPSNTFNFFNSLALMSGSGSGNHLENVPLSNEPNSDCQMMVATNKILSGFTSYLEENRGPEAFVRHLHQKHRTILADYCKRGHYAAVHSLLELGFDPNEVSSAFPKKEPVVGSANSSPVQTPSNHLAAPVATLSGTLLRDPDSPRSCLASNPADRVKPVPTTDSIALLQSHLSSSSPNLLLRSNSGVHQESNATPLAEAVSSGNLHLVKLLISYGATVSDEFVSTVSSAFGTVSRSSILNSSQNNQGSASREVVQVLKDGQVGIIDLSHGTYQMFGPTSIQSRQGIKGLKLSHNDLGPQCPPLLVAKLLQIGPGLTYLNLKYNGLQSIPAQIGDFVNLQTLSLSDNQLETLPSSLGNLSNLKILKIKKNSLSLLPEDVVKKGTPRILQYLKEITVPMHSWTRMKLLVVGRENVGKTHLIRRIQKKDYPHNMSTDGLEIVDVSMSKKIDFCIYDFGGQQVFYPTHMFFLSERSLYTVVFSALDEESFITVEYWLKVIRALSAGSAHTPVVLVGTHMDDPQAAHAIPDLHGRIKKMRQSYRNILKDVFFVSNKSGDGFKELRSKLIDLASQHKILTTPVPESYVLLEKILSKEKSHHRPLLMWPEYRALAKNAHVHDDATLRACTQFLHDVGTIIWFNSPELRDLVILSPQWLADVMASVISFKANWKSGLLQHDSLPIIWKQYPVSLHKTLLGILERFEVVFPIKGGENASIVPTMLPDSPPELLSAFSSLRLPMDQFQRIERTYKFGFMPIGFFSRLVARLFLTPTVLCHDPWLRGLMISPPDILDGIASELDENGYPCGATAEILSQHPMGVLVPPPSKAKFLSTKDIHVSDDEKLNNMQIYATSTALLRGFEQSSITYFESQQLSILNITVWKRNNPKRETTNNNLMVHIVETLEELLATNYKKYDDSIQRIIVHTASHNPSHTTEVTLPEMVHMLSYGHKTLKCRDEVVNLDDLAPDVCFTDVHRFEDVVIERELGEGGVGLIFLGNVSTAELEFVVNNVPTSGGNGGDTVIVPHPRSMIPVSSHTPSAPAGGMSGSTDSIPYYLEADNQLAPPSLNVHITDNTSPSVSLDNSPMSLLGAITPSSSSSNLMAPISEEPEAKLSDWDGSSTHETETSTDAEIISGEPASLEFPEPELLIESTSQLKPSRSGRVKKKVRRTKPKRGDDNSGLVVDGKLASPENARKKEKETPSFCF